MLPPCNANRSAGLRVFKLIISHIVHNRSVVSPDSAPIKRLIQESRERGMLIDATYGRKTASVFIMDSDHVVLSAIAADKLIARLGVETLAMEEEA